MPNNFIILLVILCCGVFGTLLINLSNDEKFTCENKLLIELNDRNEKNQKYREIQREFQNRKKRIEHLCKRLENNVNFSLRKTISKLIIDTNHDLTWCPIYKAASSVWMKNFVILSGLSNNKTLNTVSDFSSIVKQKYRRNISFEKKLKQISMTRKFMVVRHPFERLLSAYRDKLEHMQGREYYYKHYGQYVVHKYRTKQSNLTSLEPSFKEFLQFIAKEKRFDEHWIPFVDSCQPCSINYDYIFKFESLKNEYNFFISENNLQYRLNYLKNNRKNTSSQGITNDSIAEKYFEEIPASLLRSIFNIYKLDFLLYSYSPAKYYLMTNNANHEIVFQRINK